MNRLINNYNHKKYNFFYLKKGENNSYYFSKRKPYNREAVLSPKTIEKVFEFAYDMTFGGKGKHRSKRTNGDKKRRNGEKFANTFQGKLSECAACNYFYKYDKSIAPDYKVKGKGWWDSVDIKVCNKDISIKSTKHFGQLMLLESGDWDENCNYIPNINEKDKPSQYDYFLLIRIKCNKDRRTSCDEVMKDLNLFNSDVADYKTLHDNICSLKWEYDCPGYITNDELRYIINNGFIIKKGSKLQGTTKMDAENYYVQAGDFHDISEISKEFE